MDSQCSVCGSNFDVEQKIPLMLIKCGHSICKVCLNDKIQNNQQIVCKIDNKIYKSSQFKIGDFPQNHAIIQYLNQQQQSFQGSNDVHQSVFSQVESQQSQTINSVNDTFLNNTNLTEEKNQSEQSDFLIDTDCERQNTICNTHNIQNNVFCQTCETQICHNCGLFGDHKQHKFVPHQDMQEQIKELYKEFKEMQKQLNKCKEIFDNESMISSINEIIKNRKDVLRGHIIQYYEKQVVDIRKKEKDSLILLNQKSNLLQIQLQEKIKMTQERLNEKITNQLVELNRYQQTFKSLKKNSLYKIQHKVSKTKLPYFRNFLNLMQRFKDSCLIQSKDIINKVKAQGYKQPKFEVIQIWQPNNSEFMQFLENYGNLEEELSCNNEESLLTLGRTFDGEQNFNCESYTSNQDGTQKQNIEQILDFEILKKETQKVFQDSIQDQIFEEETEKNFKRFDTFQAKKGQEPKLIQKKNELRITS